MFMISKRGAVSIISVTLILIISNIFIIITFPQWQSTENSNVQSFLDGSEQKIIKVPDTDTSFNLELPINAEVTKATLNLSVEDYNGKYPLNPRLRFNASKTWLWNYQGYAYGDFGRQNYFVSDILGQAGITERDLLYNKGLDNTELSIKLPSNAKIKSANMNITAFEFDSWDKDGIQLNLEPDRAGDYEPEILEFKNKLFVVYRTYYDNITNGSDSDIVITSSANGTIWDPVIEITEKPDSVPPYNQSYDSADWRPVLESFDNKLFCAWESNSTSTDGTDHDILLRASSDGTTWDQIINVTDQWEGIYSNNSGLKNDWNSDLIVFNNSLWLVWTTNNTGNESGYDNPIGDIIITNSSDGINWNLPIDLTADDDWYINDFGPSLAVFNDTLYVAWVSNNSEFSKKDPTDFDIVFRSTTDGVQWSDINSINPPDNNFLTGKGGLDTKPVLTNYDGKLFCVWMSTSSYTHGNDMDIYLRYTMTGDFTELGQSMEITNSENDIYDHSPTLLGFNNRMYFLWVTEFTTDNNNVKNNYSEIFVNYLDLSTFDNGIQEQLGPLDDDGFDYWPQLASFKNVLYAVWDSNDTQTGTGGDRDIILSKNSISEKPFEFGLDIGGDNKWEYSIGTTISDTKSHFDLAAGIKQILANDTWVNTNEKISKYGYSICYIPLKFLLPEPCLINVADLDVLYDCTIQINDISEQLNEYINNNKQKANEDNILIVPFNLFSDTPGKIRVSDIRIEFNYKPMVEFVNIPQNGVSVTEPRFQISWKDFDPDDNAMISIFFDSDQRNFDGSLIAANISEDDIEDHYDWAWWNWDELRSGGKYYLYANISDGTNFHREYAQGELRLDEININQFLDISILEPDGISDSGWDMFRVNWEGFSYSGFSQIAFYYDLDNKSYDGLQIDLNGDGQVSILDVVNQSTINLEGSFDWDISGLLPGTPYYIYAQLTNQYNISVQNYSSGPLTRLHMPAPRNLTLIEALEPDAENVTTHVKTPKVQWLPPVDDSENISISQKNLEYVLRVWTGTDTNGEKIFELETDQLEATINPVKPLKYGNSYHIQVFARSVPDNNESTSSSLTFTLVNHHPGAPKIMLAPNLPKTTSTITCSITNHSVDLDGDDVEYYYYWFKNGNRQFEYDNISLIPPSATTKGEIWKCTVTPNDGIELGENYSYQVKIQNSAPQIELNSPKDGDEYVEGDRIVFEFTVTDPDPGDYENIQYVIFDQQNGRKLHSAYVPSDTGIVKASTTLSEGTYDIKINVSDGIDSSQINVEIMIKAPEPDPLEAVILPVLVVVIILIVILLLLFLMLFNRIQRMKREVSDTSSTDDLESDIERTGKDNTVMIDEELLAVEEPVSEEEEPVSEDKVDAADAAEEIEVEEISDEDFEE